MCDAIFLKWTNNINRTAHEDIDAAGVSCNQNLAHVCYGCAAAHPTRYAFTSLQHVGQKGSKYSNITAATKTGTATRQSLQSIQQQPIITNYFAK